MKFAFASLSLIDLRERLFNPQH